MTAYTSASRLPRVYGFTTPLEIEAGEGCELIAEDGERFLDCISGYGVTNTGHCHPRIVAAIQAQAARLLHISTVGRRGDLEAYAARLGALAPMPDAKVFFTNSGTESIEAALKLVRYATGRPMIAAFQGGFHGRTYGSLSVSTSKATMRTGHEPLLPGVLVVPYPRTELAPTLAAIDELFVLQALPERVAAFVVEPVLGEGGYVVPPDGFLPALRQLCDRHEILLVVDEVQSGFGRSGRMWAVEHTGVEPDVITAAKGIASGLPMGALIARGELLDAWPPGAHGNTYGGNPLALAAATATLDVLEDEGLADNATLRGEELLAGLRDVAARLPGMVVDVRGRGLMVALELPSGAIAERACEALLARKVICGSCGPNFETLRFAPPLTIDTSVVARVVTAVNGALAELAAS